MMRRCWSAFALAAVALAIVPSSATAARMAKVTKGLDYLHSQQQATGGFGTATATGWGILGLVATGERTGSSAWTVGGKNPMTYLQSVSHEQQSTSGDANAPVYYARTILAYIAADRENLIYGAGSQRVDLLTKLYGYQSFTDLTAASYGSFSLSTSNPGAKAVYTTAWAILALKAMGIDNERSRAATHWLAGQQLSGGGFATEPSGTTANAVSTSLAVLALVTGGEAEGVPDALTYLKTQQLGRGGLKSGPDENHVDAEATALGIQAISAGGGNPNGPAWSKSGDPKNDDTPFAALKRLQVARGAFAASPGVLGSSPVATTSLAIISLSKRTFVTYPRKRPAAVKAFAFRPQFLSLTPKNKTTFKYTRIVLISAKYNDGKGGTGVKPSAVRVYVDGVNRTRPASIGHYSLQLRLTNVPNGSHTYKIVVQDYAGNQRSVERTFTVAVPLPGPTVTPTSNGYPPPTIAPRATPRATSTPTTLFPDASDSTLPSAAPSPTDSGLPVTGTGIGSTSPSPLAGAGGGDEGGSAGFLAGVLLAMLPIGAALCYYIFQRRAQALAGAGEGQVLHGGGSAWQRLKQVFAKSKDIVKPIGTR